VTSIALVVAADGAAWWLRDFLSLQAEVTSWRRHDAGVAAQAVPEWSRGTRTAAGGRHRGGHADLDPCDVIESVLPRGVPIFCEKPLCDIPGAPVGWRRPQATACLSWTSGVSLRRAGTRRHRAHPASWAVVGLRTLRIGYGHDYRDTDCVWTLLPHDLAIAAEILGGLPAPCHAVADLANGEPMGLFRAVVGKQSRSVARGRAQASARPSDSAPSSCYAPMAWRSWRMLMPITS